MVMVEEKVDYSFKILDSILMLRPFNSKEEVIKNWNIDSTFKPTISDEDRAKRIKGWNKAVKYAYGWAKED